MDHFVQAHIVLKQIANINNRIIK